MAVTHPLDNDRQPALASTPFYCAVLFAILLAYHATLYLLWSVGSAAYWAWMNFMGAEPWKYPFFDTAAVTSWVECHQAGIDILQVNPCDPLNRLLGYSPLILDLHLDRIGIYHTTPFAMALDAAFLLAMTLVLRPHSRPSLAVALLASLSSAALFGIERANLDLFEFTLISFGAFVALRGALARPLAYLIFIFGGLLKFYPLALLILLVRERLVAAIAYGAAATAVVVAFAVHYWSSLTRLREQSLGPLPWGDRFGSLNLPFVAPDYLGLPHGIGWLFYWLLACPALYAAFRLAARLGPALPLDWESPNHFLLAVGSILIVGCFFTGLSNGYRATMLIFTVPGLLELTASARDRGARRLVTVAFILVLCCLWRQFFEFGLLHLGLLQVSRGGDLAFIVLREVVWWAAISFLVSFIMLFVSHSTAWRDLVRLCERAQRSRSAPLS